MDKHFLEFWGNVMLASAKGQQQLDDIMKWFSGNFGEYKDITALFCRMYGIDPDTQKTSGFGVWQKAFDEFQRSFSELVIMMDLVPRKEYIEISRENQDLKKRIAELEEGNAHLRALLAEKVKVPEEGIKDFEKLINEQARQYQDFMKSVTSVFDEGAKAPAAKPKAPEKAKAKPQAAKPKPRPAKAAKRPAPK